MGIVVHILYLQAKLYCLRLSQLGTPSLWGLPRLATEREMWNQVVDDTLPKCRHGLFRDLEISVLGVLISVVNVLR